MISNKKFNKKHIEEVFYSSSSINVNKFTLNHANFIEELFRNYKKFKKLEDYLLYKNEIDKEYFSIIDLQEAFDAAFEFDFNFTKNHNYFLMSQLKKNRKFNSLKTLIRLNKRFFS